jgi:hypothetical protein
MPVLQAIPQSLWICPGYAAAAPLTDPDTPLPETVAIRLRLVKCRAGVRRTLGRDRKQSSFFFECCGLVQQIRTQVFEGRTDAAGRRHMRQRNGELRFATQAGTSDDSEQSGQASASQSFMPHHWP